MEETETAKEESHREISMKKPSEDIFAYGMAQLPIATGRTEPPQPYKDWAIKFHKLEAIAEAAEFAKYMAANSLDRALNEQLQKLRDAILDYEKVLR